LPKKEYRRIAALYGSNENLARWRMLGDTVRWCTVVLGAARARNVVERSSTRHEHLARMMRYRYKDAPVEAYDRQLADVALALIARAVPAALIYDAIDAFAGVTRGEAPWIDAWSEALQLARFIDRSLDA
jgi:aspartyl/asparaginyl beta-hydroxylase (cupin superfamily)